MEMNEEIRKMTDIIDYQLGDLAGNAEDAAKALYGLGYRQTNEVRKETVKEILKDIKRMLEKEDEDYCYLLSTRIAEKYGVEVEE